MANYWGGQTIKLYDPNTKSWNDTYSPRNLWKPEYKSKWGSMENWINKKFGYYEDTEYPGHYYPYKNQPRNSAGGGYPGGGYPGGGYPGGGYPAGGYGGEYGGGAGGGFPELFQPDLFPHSSSTSTSSSYSGLPAAWRDKIAGASIPQLLDLSGKLPDTVNQYMDPAIQTARGGSTQAIRALNKSISRYRGNVGEAMGLVDTGLENAARLYARQSRQAYGQEIPGLLSGLAARNVLDSSISADAMTNLGNKIVPLYANKTYEAASEAAKTKGGYQMQMSEGINALRQLQANMRMQRASMVSGLEQSKAGMHYGIPSILAQIAALAKYSQSQSQSDSMSANPLAPYEMLSNFILNY